MSNHLVVDLETMGRSTTAAIIEIGAVVFDPEGDLLSLEEMNWSGDKFYSRVSLDSSLAAGLTTDPSTISWWLVQCDEARKEAAAAIEQGINIKSVLGAFATWTRGAKVIRYWSHGASFDLPILEYAYQRVGYHSPFDFRLMRDTRTLFELADVKYKGPQEGGHTALRDAWCEANAIQRAWQSLKGKGKGKNGHGC